MLLLTIYRLKRTYQIFNCPQLFLNSSSASRFALLCCSRASTAFLGSSISTSAAAIGDLTQKSQIFKAGGLSDRELNLSKTQKMDDDEDEIEVNGDQQAGVSLGVLSGLLDKEYINDISVSRCGGYPVWCEGASPSESEITCPFCKKPEFLVAQIYAPFGGHRALHIFGCNSAKCSKNRGVCVLYV